MKCLARLYLTQPRLLLLLLAVLFGAAGWGASRLTIDDEPLSILRSEDEEFRRLEQVFEDFGSDDGSCLLLLEGADPFTPEGSLALRSLVASLSEQKDLFEEVRSLASLFFFDGPLPQPLLPGPGASIESFDLARSRAANHPLARDLLLARDGRSNLVLVRLREDARTIAELRTAVAAIEKQIEACGPFKVSLTGIPPLRVLIFDAIRREQILLTLIGGLAGALVSTLVFRRLAPVLITSGVSMASSWLAMGVLGLSGQQINLINAELPVLVMVIALTDAMHMMLEVLHHFDAGAPAWRAGAHALRRLGLACLLTTLTTAIGFASLAVSDITIIRAFGLTFAASILLALLVVVLALPLCSALFLRRRVPPASAVATLTPRSVAALLRHPGKVTLCATALTILLSLRSLQLVPENRLTEAVPDGAAAPHTLARIDALFGGSVEVMVLVESEGQEQLLAATAAVAETLRHEPLAQGVLSIHDLLSLSPLGPEQAVQALPDSIQRPFLRRDLLRSLVRFRVKDQGSSETRTEWQDLAAHLEELELAWPGTRLNLTGTGFVARRNLDLIITDFAQGISSAALTIFLVLTLAFRSWRLGLASIIPNAFPLAVAGCTLSLLDLELQISTVLAFTVCLGLAVDDTIHLVSRYQECLARGLPAKDAVARALTGTGRALVITTLILLAGWAALLFSSIPTTRLFGLIGTIGLAAALLGDLVILPAILVLIGPPRRRRAAH